MDKIFQYKPVNNYYTYVRASLYLQENKLDMVRQMLIGKENWHFPGPYAVLLAQIHYETEARGNHPFAAKMQKIQVYYTYMALMAGKSENRNIFIDEGFLTEAKNCYEIESTHEMELVLQGVSDWKTMKSEEKAEYLWALFETEYNLANFFLYVLSLFVRDTLKSLDPFWHNYYWDYVIGCEPNYGFLRYQLSEVAADEFLIITDEYFDAEHAALIENLLRTLGKKCNSVCWIDENQVVSQLKKMLEKKNYYNLIASRFSMIKLKQNGMVDYAECLSEYRGEIHFDDISFGYLGNYTEYVSRIYRYNFKKELEKEDFYLFSVVIPARNSANTLRYTLQTVLKQRAIEKEEYEIIVSDNSTDGNESVKNLIEELSEPQIKYYKTPVDLPLQKSFEFAYGKARGSYIIPLGSDDGMLPWALETLKKMVLQYNNENVVCWERGFFQWSGTNSVQSGKFVVPRSYRKDCYQESLVNGIETLKSQTAVNGTLIYGIPLYYINTAFRRKYLKDILDKTGKILDGYTQDINMAIKGLALNDNFLFLKYPLTIAGMADQSLGANMAIAAKNNVELINKLKTETPRGYGFTPVKAELPFQVIASTEGLFWSEFFRDYAEDCFREKLNKIIQGHDFKKTFLILTGCRSRKALDYIMILEKLHYNAWCLDDELGMWYDQVLYPAATEKLYWTGEEELAETGYETGFSDNGGLVLDARQFGVDNIAEAVELFQKITNL